MKISIIIPTLNEPKLLGRQLQKLQAWRRCGHEVIVADGGRESLPVEAGQCK